MITFVTPYWSGREQMTIHLESIRRFHPSAPILVSKKGGGSDEMEDYRVRLDVRYWLEECTLFDALLRLLQRCETEIVCVLDHDTALLSSLDPYVERLRGGHYDLVGMEERIREPPGFDWRRVAPDAEGWLRLAPGNVASNVLLFDVRAFLARWGLRGIIGRRPARTKDHELDYGIAQRLKRHKYLLPYHTSRYGLGNLLMDGDVPILWHQWYGAHRERLALVREEGEASGLVDRLAFIEAGERAFLRDYPRLDLSDLTPAWGPDRDVVADGAAIARRRPGLFLRGGRRARDWWALGPRELVARARARLERQRLLR